MFTGIIIDVGSVMLVDFDTEVGRVQIQTSHKLPDDLKFGDSVAVNGCCLTVVEFGRQTLAFDVSAETLKVTNLDELTVGQRVNLEYALRVGDRLGGHWVLGHVDGLAEVRRTQATEGGWLLEVKAPQHLAQHLVKKGSICLDGVSLTINDLQDEANYSLVQLNLIPATLAGTHFETLEVGDRLNLEVDVLSKFAERQANKLR